MTARLAPTCCFSAGMLSDGVYPLVRYAGMKQAQMFFEPNWGKHNLVTGLLMVVGLVDRPEGPGIKLVSTTYGDEFTTWILYADWLSGSSFLVWVVLAAGVVWGAFLPLCHRFCCRRRAGDWRVRAALIRGGGLKKAESPMAPPWANTTMKFGRGPLGLTIQAAPAQEGMSAFISSVDDGSQAGKAGVVPGRVILEVNGYHVKGLSKPQVLKRIKQARRPLTLVLGVDQGRVEPLPQPSPPQPTCSRCACSSPPSDEVHSVAAASRR